MKLLLSSFAILCIIQAKAQLLMPWGGMITTETYDWSNPSLSFGNSGFGFGVDCSFMQHKKKIFRSKRFTLNPGIGIAYQKQSFGYPDVWSYNNSRKKIGFLTADIFLEGGVHVLANDSKRRNLTIGGSIGPQFSFGNSFSNTVFTSESNHFALEYGAFIQLIPRMPRMYISSGSGKYSGGFMPDAHPRKFVPSYKAIRGNGFGLRLSYLYSTTNAAISDRTGEAKYNSQVFRISVLYFFAHYQRLAVAKKPAVYCYPEQETKISIEVVPNGELKFTYPYFEQSIDVIAQANGQLNYRDQELDYVFWESYWTGKYVHEFYQTGKVVQKEDYLEFIEASIIQLGLNDKERNQFISFWLPELMKHETCFIHFALNTECDEFAKLNISPKADHVNRVYILYYPNPEEAVNAIPQNLIRLDRSGFDVMEWGGLEIPAPFKMP